MHTLTFKEPPVDVWLHATRAGWHQLCLHENLRPGTRKRHRALSDYMRGALMAGYSLGAVDDSRLGLIGILFASGRGEEYLAMPDTPTTGDSDEVSL